MGARSVAPVSKLAPAKLTVSISKTADLPNFDVDLAAPISKAQLPNGPLVYFNVQRIFITVIARGACQVRTKISAAVCRSLQPATYLSYLSFLHIMEDPTDRRPSTRAKNASQRPGLVDMSRQKRRTKAEMAQERQTKEAAAKALKQKKDNDILRVAQVEDKLAIDDANAERSHPRSRNGPPFFRPIQS